MKERENGKSALKLILFILHLSQLQVTFIRHAGMYLSFDILNAKLLKQREQIQKSSSVVLNTVYSHNRKKCHKCLVYWRIGREFQRKTADQDIDNRTYALPKSGVSVR